MRFDVLTLFPEMLSGYLGQSLLKLAIQRKLVEVSVIDLRDWATDKHRQMDDRPFGGGPGMLLMAPPVVECVEEVQSGGEQPGPPFPFCGFSTDSSDLSLGCEDPLACG